MFLVEFQTRVDDATFATLAKFSVHRQPLYSLHLYCPTCGTIWGRVIAQHMHSWQSGSSACSNECAWKSNFRDVPRTFGNSIDFPHSMYSVLPRPVLIHDFLSWANFEAYKNEKLFGRIKAEQPIPTPTAVHAG